MMFTRRTPEQRREIIQRWRQADLRFLGDVTRLAAAHVRNVRAIFDEARPAEEGPSLGTSRVVTPPQPSLIIEASAGTSARGVFLVENTLARRVEGRILVSPFADASGRSIVAPLHLEPDVVLLEPGEEMLVTVVVDMDESVPEGIRFAGRFTVPDLAETYIEAVIVRRPGAAPAADIRPADLIDVAATEVIDVDELAEQEPEPAPPARPVKRAPKRATAKKQTSAAARRSSSTRARRTATEA